MCTKIGKILWISNAFSGSLWVVVWREAERKNKLRWIKKRCGVDGNGSWHFLCFPAGKRMSLLGEMCVSCMENVCFRLVKTEKNKAFAAYCQGEIKNMLGFALFLLPEDEFLRICVTFVAYRVLTFNKHIYGSQKIA